MISKTIKTNKKQTVLDDEQTFVSNKIINTRSLSNLQINDFKSSDKNIQSCVKIIIGGNLKIDCENFNLTVNCTNNQNGTGNSPPCGPCEPKKEIKITLDEVNGSIFSPEIGLERIIFRSGLRWIKCNPVVDRYLLYYKAITPKIINETTINKIFVSVILSTFFINKFKQLCPNLTNPRLKATGHGQNQIGSIVKFSDPSKNFNLSTGELNFYITSVNGPFPAKSEILFFISFYFCSGDKCP